MNHNQDSSGGGKGDSATPEVTPQTDSHLQETGNTTMKTHDEKQMRDITAPSPRTIEELTKFIQEMADGQHDYGTCVYAMSLSATATFNFIAHKLGVTGFQASCADMDIIKRLRRLDCPFMLIKADDALYPQYDIEGRVRKALAEWKPWLKTAAEKKLSEGIAAPTVLRHWSELAYNGDNPEAKAEIEAKADFLENDFTEDFIEANQEDFKRFGIDHVLLRRDTGNIGKAETCKEGASWRLDMPVSLWFSRKIGAVEVEWSVETEHEGSNGAGKLNIDFEKLELLSEMATGEVKAAILAYIERAKRVPQI